MSKTKAFLLLLLLALMPFALFAQSSGKIVGVVKDKSSGEPLPGVNISIEGTQMGAATDVDGYFVILNVPVGRLDLRANFVGYSDVVQTGVRVTASKTTEINFSLEEAAIEGQAVIITAEKPLVEKYSTQSVSLVTSEDLENIPVRGFNDLVSTQNSVIVQDGNIHIRGGRTEEVGYYLDGASTQNPLNNTQAVYIIQEAVEEFQVLAGGYNAEFGGANSGIIRTEMKTGSSQDKVSVDFQTDKFASEGEKFLGTYSYRDHVLIATLGGPILPGNDKYRFYAAYENNSEGDYQKRFSSGFTFTDLIDLQNDRPNDDTLDISYPDGFTPNNSRDRNSFNGTLLFDFSPLQIRASAAYTDFRRDNEDTPMLDVLNDRVPQRESNTMLLSLKSTYVVNPKTFVEASINSFNYQRENKDDWFGSDWWLWNDSAAVHDYTNGEVIYRSKYTPQPEYLLNGFPFERNGDPPSRSSTFYLNEKTSYIGGSLDFVSQMGRSHEVKVGASMRQYTSRYYQSQPNRVTLQLASNPNWNEVTDIPADVIARAGRITAYGYDNYGNEIDNDLDLDSLFNFGPRKPLFMAFYAQDKIEYRDLIINAGLRLDYFDTDDKTLKDPDNPAINEDTGYPLVDGFKDVDPFVQVSPRLGLSFPVSEKTVFYTQYGKFIQTPELNDIYFGTFDFVDQISQGGNFFQNPIGFGLEPIRTTSYEIGFRQQLSPVAAFDLTGFYRNVKGQVKVIEQDLAPDAKINNVYNRLVNGDFATTQGLEFGLTLRRTNRIQAQFNYTYTDAEGTASNETFNLSALSANTPSPLPTLTQPLDFAQKHVGSLILDYRFGRNDGGSVLQQFGANMLFSFTSGHPYTPAIRTGLGQGDPYTFGVEYMQDARFRKAAAPVGSGTTPWNYTVDLRLDKTINLMEKLSATVYMRVENLFNTQNVLNVYELTGQADDDGFLGSPLAVSTIANNGGEDYINMYRAINLTNGQAYWDQIVQEIYATPRQIFFGIKFNY